MLVTIDWIAPIPDVQINSRDLKSGHFFIRLATNSRVHGRSNFASPTMCAWTLPQRYCITSAKQLIGSEHLNCARALPASIAAYRSIGRCVIQFAELGGEVRSPEWLDQP